MTPDETMERKGPDRRRRRVIVDAGGGCKSMSPWCDSEYDYKWAVAFLSRWFGGVGTLKVEVEGDGVHVIGHLELLAIFQEFGGLVPEPIEYIRSEGGFPWRKEKP